MSANITVSNVTCTNQDRINPDVLGGINNIYGTFTNLTDATNSLFGRFCNPRDLALRGCSENATITTDNLDLLIGITTRLNDIIADITTIQPVCEEIPIAPELKMTEIERLELQRNPPCPGTWDIQTGLWKGDDGKLWAPCRDPTTCMAGIARPVGSNVAAMQQRLLQPQPVEAYYHRPTNFRYHSIDQHSDYYQQPSNFQRYNHSANEMVNSQYGNHYRNSQHGGNTSQCGQGRGQSSYESSRGSYTRSYSRDSQYADDYD